MDRLYPQREGREADNWWQDTSSQWQVGVALIGEKEGSGRSREDLNPLVLAAGLRLLFSVGLMLAL